MTINPVKFWGPVHLPQPIIETQEFVSQTNILQPLANAISSYESLDSSQLYADEIKGHGLAFGSSESGLALRSWLADKNLTPRLDTWSDTPGRKGSGQAHTGLGHSKRARCIPRDQRPINWRDIQFASDIQLSLFTCDTIYREFGSHPARRRGGPYFLLRPSPKKTAVSG